jgi:hypothetical protein
LIFSKIIPPDLINQRPLALAVERQFKPDASWLCSAIAQMKKRPPRQVPEAPAHSIASCINIAAVD